MIDKLYFKNSLIIYKFIIYMINIGNTCIFRLDQASVRTSVFTDDMDEMFFWIDETETIISTPLQPDQSYLEDLLEKIRASAG